MTLISYILTGGPAFWKVLDDAAIIQVHVSNSQYTTILVQGCRYVFKLRGARSNGVGTIYLPGWNKGTSINDVPLFLVIFDQPTYLDLISTVRFWRLCLTPLPTLISNVINGRSLRWTETPNSEWAKSHPAHFLTTSLQCASAVVMNAFFLLDIWS